MIEFDAFRLIFAFVCGAFLSLSGTFTQATTNNGLASPSTLGFDGVGALSVVVAQAFLAFSSINISLEYFSFVVFLFFSLIVFGLIFKISSTGRFNVASLNMNFLIIAGLSFNLFVGAVFSIIQFLFMAMNYEFPTGLWFGSFRYYHQDSMPLFIVVLIVSFFVVIRNMRGLRLLVLGQDFALGKGVNVGKVQRETLIWSLFLTGVVISFFGVFSFMSLIAPHIIRSFGFIRKDLKREILYGPLLSGVGMSFLDWLCFHFDFMGAELPVGMLSSVIGAFLLMFLLWRSKLKSFAKG